jgi:hypothetical protein
LKSHLVLWYDVNLLLTTYRANNSEDLLMRLSKLWLSLLDLRRRRVGWGG